MHDLHEGGSIIRRRKKNGTQSERIAFPIRERVKKRQGGGRRSFFLRAYGFEGVGKGSKKVTEGREKREELRRSYSVSTVTERPLGKINAVWKEGTQRGSRESFVHFRDQHV